LGKKSKGKKSKGKKSKGKKSKGKKSKSPPVGTLRAGSSREKREKGGSPAFSAIN